jgi:hypothetical protein
LARREADVNSRDNIVALHKLVRETLERYLEPAACKKSPTPITLSKLHANKCIDRIGRDAGNFPIYHTNEKGRAMLLAETDKSEK